MRSLFTAPRGRQHHPCILFSKNKLQPVYLLVVLAVGVHVLFWLSLSRGWLDPLFNDATHRLPRGVDFYSVYQKSYDLSVGKSLYTDIGSDTDETRYLVVPYCAPYYRYLPSWGWFVSHTFVRMSPERAYWVWVILCEAMMLTCLVTLLRKTNDLKKRVWLVVFWLCYTPLYLELFLGQFTFMATGLITLALVAYDQRRNWRGTIWLAASVLLKYVGLVLLIPLVVFCRWRHALAVAGGVAVVCALYFVPHPGDWSLFLGVARYGTDNPIHAGNLGLQGLLGNLLRLVPNQDSSLAAATGFVLLKVIPALIVVFILSVTWRHRSAQSFIPICLLWLTGYFLAGTDVFEHHYVLLLPVFSFAYIRTGSPWLIVIYAWIALPTIFNIVDWPGLPKQRYFEVEEVWWQHQQYARIFAYHLWKIVPAGWLFAWLVRMVLRGGDDTQEDIGQPCNERYV